MTPFETPEAVIAAAGGTTERYRPGAADGEDTQEAPNAEARWGGQEQARPQDDRRGRSNGGGRRNGSGAEAPDYVPYSLVDPTALFGRTIPARQWIVEDWLPVGHATANYGDGGVGKTLLAQQLMTSCATGKPWCGRDVLRCRTLGLFCEDSEDELHRRQDKINDCLGLNFNDLGDMRWISGIGADNILMAFEYGGLGAVTDRFREITNKAVRFSARLVVIDTAADVYGGNENDRSQVRQFIGRALNKLAMDIKGAVLLNAHPSRTGMSATGDLDGGSTAWSNTVRSRWSLSRPKAEDGAEVDTDERVLTRRKANYAAAGEAIRLRWLNGALVPNVPENAAQGIGGNAAVEQIFLTLLDRCEAQGVYVSNSKNAGNFVAKVFGKRPDRDGYRGSDFEQAMHRLFGSGQIETKIYDRFGHRKIARVTAADVAE